MNRRSFFKSLGLILVSPAIVVRAIATEKPKFRNRIHNLDMVGDKIYYCRGFIIHPIKEYDEHGRLLTYK